MKKKRDIKKSYPVPKFIEKIRRLADALESGEDFVIQVAKERIYIPKTAKISVEHERGKESEELEFQLTWKPSIPSEKTSKKKKKK
jgi:amphi-Trp domain-containing protein